MSTKVKVVHLSSAHPDGDTRIFHKMCASSAKAGYDTSLILAGVKERTEQNVRIYSVEKTAKGRFSRVLNTVNSVYKKALELDADIYHLHDPELLRIGKKLIKNGKKVVYDAHEDLPRQILSKPYLKFRKPIGRLAESIENKYARKMSAIIAATPTIRDRFLKINSNCVDVNNYPILDELFDSEIKLGPSVCYVGGITKVRGLHELLEIANPEAKLILAGKFQTEALYEEAKNHKNWKHIDYRGFLDREGVKKVYEDSSIGLVTLHPIANYLDSLPVKMFEYMAAGKAVIASDFPLWRKIIEEANCGVCVNPLDTDSIDNAIVDLKSNPELLSAYGKNGRKAVIEKYNWTIEEKKLLDLYNKLVSR